MKSVVIILLLLAYLPLKAQNSLKDMQLINQQQKGVQAFGVKKKKKTFNPLSILYAGTLGFYQTQVSAQWGANCAFELTCSRFSKEMVKEYGLAKGFFLTFDRIGRCSKISYFETLPVRINQQGKIIDNVEFYRVRQ